MLGKIIVSYTIFIVQIIIIIFQLLLSFLIRFVQDRCSGLQIFINKFLIIATEGNGVELNIEKMIMLVLIMVFNLLLIQLIIILITSKYTNGQQMASFQGLLYVGLLIIYYLTMIISEQLIKNKLVKYISYIPLFSMVLIPQRIINSKINILGSLISLMLVVLTIITLTVKCSDKYKRNLLIQK